MFFSHSNEIWTQCPELVPGAMFVRGISSKAAVGPQVARFSGIAAARLARSGEGELPEIKAWRQVFSKMGLKPTKYRCAAEALLRRLRKEGALPRLHPLVDLCNAVSAAFAIPVAVFDLSKVVGDLQVRYTTGLEHYQTFAGEVEHPDAHEIIFADEADNAHARRWTNRQSSLSAVSADTSTVLIVAEALHESAYEDMRTLIAALMHEVPAAWPAATAKARLLTRSAPRFELQAPAAR
ncbi:B3/4 domain-containing protein [Polaromonas sp. AER18D-145]|uniref:B3/B4 domain-containing protein n=1 Tax=Polaromonas sp. AER18D-145 TaxID=1977060 RepID=UPI000BBC27FF|nr:phenylalanine--tRNA ligase beta subunit-related protein [Polaromonas sp. AER18D-145]